MEPVVKWAGGKRGEIEGLKPHYPDGFTRVVEPFAGGAAVAWDLAGTPAVLNDVNEDLIGFYRTLQDTATRQACAEALNAIGRRRDELRQAVLDLSEASVQGFFSQPDWLEQHPLLLAQTSTLPALDARFAVLLAKHARAKQGRIHKLQAKHAVVFDVANRREHLETAVQSAWYEALRDIYNRLFEVPAGWQAAAWWAVRVLCYSGMMRYNKQGRFNVPYGGISYNRRKFDDSFVTLFGPERVAALSQMTFTSLDFAALLERLDGGAPTDFLFVDPPYDSSFSQYNAKDDFTRADQVRLRDTLEASAASWMLVIKRTPFIEALYAERGLHLYVFDKSYQANFRNRHDRAVHHLVVTNYPLHLRSEDALRPASEVPPLPDTPSVS